MFNGAIAAIFVRAQTERQFREQSRRPGREQAGQGREQAGQGREPGGHVSEQRFRERSRPARVLPSGARSGRALHRRAQVRG